LLGSRPSLAPHAAPSWHRRHGLARAIVVRPSPAPPARIRPEDHLDLVRTIALAYKKKIRHCGLEVEDLAQEGWFALIAACERYDPGRKIPFESYARWCIAVAIRHAMDRQAYPVRVPHYVRVFFRNELARTLDPATGLGARDRACLDAARPLLSSFPVQESEAVEGLFLADLAVDYREADPAAAELDRADGPRPLRVPITDDRLRLRDALAALPAIERSVIRLGYGLDGGEPLTHAQVAARLGFTRNGCRGIRLRALRRLRAMLGVAPPKGRHPISHPDTKGSHGL
jgi:RNA polymerase primary sigma factor